MLEIKDLVVRAGERQILNGLSLSIPTGEVHAIMGPNGSGKSTLSYILSGRPGYDIVSGSVTLDGVDLLGLDPEERAQLGMFLAFQYPVEIPGVPTTTFLRTALNSILKARGEKELDAIGFLRLLRSKTKALGITEEMLKRAVNVGFSGGEKKRNEILQMTILEPKFAVLDETDSGLDIDALRVVADGVNALRSPNRSMLVITHYQRLLEYIVPDRIHVLANGKIQRSGGRDLAHELEASGYAAFVGDEAA